LLCIEEGNLSHKKDDRKKLGLHICGYQRGAEKICGEKVSKSSSPSSSSSSYGKKHKRIYVPKLGRNAEKDRKLPDKPRLAGGHDIQTHPPIHE
jgi:hypothetical protein